MFTMPRLTVGAAAVLRFCWAGAVGGGGGAAAASVLSPLSAASLGVTALTAATGEGGAASTTVVAAAAGLATTGAAAGVGAGGAGALPDAVAVAGAAAPAAAGTTAVATTGDSSIRTFLPKEGEIVAIRSAHAGKYLEVSPHDGRLRATATRPVNHTALFRIMILPSSMVELLIDAGADVDAKDHRG